MPALRPVLPTALFSIPTFLGDRSSTHGLWEFPWMLWAWATSFGLLETWVALASARDP